MSAAAAGHSQLRAKIEVSGARALALANEVEDTKLICTRRRTAALAATEPAASGLTAAPSCHCDCALTLLWVMTAAALA